MIVTLHQPRRQLEIRGPKTVVQLLDHLELSREGHLVIRNGTLVPTDTALDGDDVIEIRPVISGGQ